MALWINIITMNLTGQILISLPNIEDDRFHKSVIYICAHSKEGSMGIIINKSLEIEMYPNLLKQLGIDKYQTNKKIFFHYGGPVETGRGFILHSDDFIKDESMVIDSGIVLTSTADFFIDLAKGVGPKISMLALGYAGWGPGQLEKEISKNGWMITTVNSNFIFDENNSKKWSKAYDLIGINPYSISNNFGRA